MRGTFIRKLHAVLALTCGLIGLLHAHVAVAGSLSVLPVRVEVAATKQFCSLKIGNGEKEDVTVQVRGFRWHQDDGTDALDEAQSIAINPSIVTIPAGTDKLVRCSLPAQVGAIESTYRLIVSELPRADAEPGTLQTLLQLSIPVFRALPDSSAILSWAATADGHLVVTNTGTRHTRIAELVVHPNAAEPITARANFYLLAGASRIVEADVGANGIAAVEAMTEDGFFIAVSPDPASQP